MWPFPIYTFAHDLPVGLAELQHGTRAWLATHAPAWRGTVDAGGARLEERPGLVAGTHRARLTLTLAFAPAAATGSREAGEARRTRVTGTAEFPPGQQVFLTLVAAVVLFVSTQVSVRAWRGELTGDVWLVGVVPLVFAAVFALFHLTLRRQAQAAEAALCAAWQAPASRRSVH